MAKRKASTLMDSNEEATSTSVVQPEDVDEGHRFGNFRNYYAFHPTSARLRHLTDILTYIGKNCSKTTKTFEYCDLGCNEGDLTMEVADALEQQVDCPVHFTGIDMDTVLIDRAKKKLVSNDKSNERITGNFVIGNVCTDLDTLLEDDSVDLTSLFSTTMWIHLHAGDDGLRKLLEQVCRKTTQFVLIEPQPSKCYRSAIKRLRRLGRPEMDISSERLKLRPNIEEEIDTIMQSSGFQQVSFSSRTQWNRACRLYQRRNDLS